MVKNYWKHRKDKWGKLQRRRWRIRKKISGTGETPRLMVRKTGRHIYAQLIDDSPENGSLTLFTLSTNEKNGTANKNFCNIENAKSLGGKVGKEISGKGISQVVFDRGGYRYHGVIKAFAEAVREAGVTI